MNFIIVMSGLFIIGLIGGFAFNYVLDKNPKLLEFLSKIF